MTPEILDEYMTQWQNQLYAGGILASIDSFDKSTMTAKVNPLYKVRQYEKEIKLPVLVEVPVSDFCAGKWTITFDYTKGDIVLLIPNTFQTTNALKGIFDLATDIRYRLENAVIISGFRKRPIIPNPSIPKEGLVISHEDGDYFQLKKDQIKYKTKKFIIDGDVEINGKLEVDKDITWDKTITPTKASTHTHPTPTGPSGSPVKGS